MRLIDGYTLDACLHAGRVHTVWRGRRNTDLLPIALKYINIGCVSPTLVARLRREYEFFLKLKGSAAPCAVDFLEHPEGPVFILEDTGSKTLACEILRGPLDHKTFLHIAAGLVQALATLHTSGLVHRTLATSNILLDSKKVVRFGDLDGAFDRTNPATLTLPEGFSPHNEVTMPEGIPDCDGDYTALGYVLLSMLTGHTLPLHFLSAHRLLESPDLPKSFVRIIRKLITDVPEERYPNLDSVEADLQSCQDLPSTLAHGTIVPKPSRILHQGSFVGTKKAYTPERLYGRSREVETLRQFRDKAAKGEGQFVIVCGPSGMGKTHLVFEAMHPPIGPSVPVIRITFEKKAYNPPYNTFVTAITEYLQNKLQQTEATFHTLRACFDTLPAEEVSVLCDLIPSLSFFIGRQPVPHQLPTHENTVRLFRSVLHFFEVLACPSHPLVVLFEDLHNADVSSLALTKFILSESKFRYLLFIGTLREDGTGASDQIETLLQNYGKKGHTPSLITLGALCVDDVTLLLADMFNGAPPGIEDLARLFTAYCGGNPFWILTTLHLWKAEKKITFNRDTWTWSWTRNTLEELDTHLTAQSYLAQYIERLSPSCYESLLRAACCGMAFRIRDLTYTKDNSDTDVLESLGSALDAHLITPQREKNTETPSTLFRFGHNIVRDVILSLSTSEKKEKTHLDLGIALYEHLSPDEISDDLFKTLGYFQAAKVWIRRPDLLQKIAIIAYHASRRADFVSCHIATHTYAALGLKSLGKHPWNTDPDLGRRFFHLQAEAAYALGYHEDLQILVERFLKDTNDVFTAAPALEHQIFALSGEGQNNDVMSLLSQTLGQIGLNVQDRAGRLSRLLSHVHLTWLTHVLTHTQPLPHPQEEPRIQAIVSLLFMAATTCCPNGPSLSYRGITTLLHLALRTKETKLLAAAYAITVMQTAQNGCMRFSEHLARRTIELSDTLPPSIMSVRSKIAACYLGLHWNYPLQDLQSLLRHCIYEAQRVADHRSTITAMSISAELALYRGTSLPQLTSDLTEALGLCQRIDRKHRNFWLSTAQRMCHLLMQDELAAADIAQIFEKEQHAFEDALLSTSPVLANAAGTVLIFGAILLGEYEHAQKIAQRLVIVAKRAEGTAAAAQYDWLSAIAVLKSHGIPEKKRQKAVRPLLRALKERADIGAANHLQRFLLIKAEMARSQKKWDTAESLYARAFQTAADNELYADQIITCLLAASFHEEHHQPRMALSWRHQAVHVSQRWGAGGLVSLFHSRWPDLQEHASKGTVSLSTSPRPDDTLLATLHAARILSGELDKPHLLQNTLRFAVHLTQAERGLLLLRSGEGWTVEAESRIISDQHIKVERHATCANSTSPHSDLLSLLSPAVLSFAADAGKPVVLENAIKTGAFVLDPYICQNNILSLLCTPFTQDNTVVGMLWLESSHHTDLFTPSRVAAISQISAQAVVSLNNARMYTHVMSLNQGLENRIEEYAHTLNHQNRLVDSLLEALPDALIACNSKEQLIAWNRKACDVLGVSKSLWNHDTLLSSLITVAVSGESSDHGNRFLTENFSSELENHFKDNIAQIPVSHNRTLRVYRQAMYGEGYIYIFRDITDDLQKEQDLVEARRQATKALSDLHSAHHNLVQAEKMASLGELVAGVAHEVSTPIGTALTAASFLTGRAKSIREHLEQETLKKSDLDSFIAQLTEMTFAMVNSMERASDLVGSFKQVAVDRSTEEEITFSLAPHIKTVCQSFTPLIDRAGHRLKIKCPPHLKIYSRPGVLSQVLSNFITNALTHAYEAGKKGTLTINVTYPDVDTVYIAFSDDGKGILPELLDRIFDPFFTTKRGSGGSGLGLSIAYNLVTGVLGGTLSVTSRVGEGTQFIMTIPACAHYSQEDINTQTTPEGQDNATEYIREEMGISPEV